MPGTELTLTGPELEKNRAVGEPPLSHPTEPQPHTRKAFSTQSYFGHVWQTKADMGQMAAERRKAVND